MSEEKILRLGLPEMAVLNKLLCHFEKVRRIEETGSNEEVIDLLVKVLSGQMDSQTACVMYGTSEEGLSLIHQSEQLDIVVKIIILRPIICIMLNLT